MSFKKLTAGAGYDYLTRQVARLDATESGHASLHSYYSEKGEKPGRWIGSGVTDIEGLSVGSVVTESQMKSLFGSGHHPLAPERLAALPLDASAKDAELAVRLGKPFLVSSQSTDPFQVEVARRIEDVNIAAGHARDADVDADLRATIRDQVAVEMFREEHGRQHLTDRELSSFVAKHSRPANKAIAGFDLTFSPVKSVSTLWAIAPRSVAQRIEKAHDAAVGDTLTFIEKHVLYSRAGAQGVQQVDVTGLVATAFKHRDSRAGDPDLHTHVAVANKVKMLDEDGRWLSVDGQPLHKAIVAASETYNTALEFHLRDMLGVRFTPRKDKTGKRPIREIVGVPDGLNKHWSKRRVQIERRRAELSAVFQKDHGRHPTPIEAIGLAERANKETRERKHSPRSEGDQRAVWRREAAQVLGSEAAIHGVVQAALRPVKVGQVAANTAWMSATSDLIIDVLSQERSQWDEANIMAEGMRQIRGADVPAEALYDVLMLLADAVTAKSVRVGSDRDEHDEPDYLRRADGASKYHHVFGDVYTSAKVLAAESRTLEAAGLNDGARLEAAVVDAAIEEATSAGIELNVGQLGMVRGMATSGRRVELCVAAAGTGKTRSMSVLTSAWERAGGTVIGLAPSATAAAELRSQTDAPTDTLAKFVQEATFGFGRLVDEVNDKTLIIVDEAGMADTLSLDAVLQFALGRRASVRLVGDTQQLSAIGAGGLLRDIEALHGAIRLTEVRRFNDPAEGAATLALRDGRPEALGYYLDRRRVTSGDQSTLLDAVFARWSTDIAEGKDSIMLAPTRDHVRELNLLAREARLGLAVDADNTEVELADGNAASVGDTVITRRNDRGLCMGQHDWVKNGDRWAVQEVGPTGLTVDHQRTGRRVVLPNEYVAEHTELGYASTVHTAQGVTVDTMHGLVTGHESRQQLYTMMSRGRDENHAYVVTVGDGDPHDLIAREVVIPPTATDVLEGVIARDGAARSATATELQSQSPHVRLGQAVERYVDALHTASEKVVGSESVAAIEHDVNLLVPGIVDDRAWPTLRSHLIWLEADGGRAVVAFADALAERPMEGARDRAATLDWRLAGRVEIFGGNGPLPWVPDIPRLVAADETWDTYLHGRAASVARIADEVRRTTVKSASAAWATYGLKLPAEIRADLAVWRAATKVDETDRRLTGPRQIQKAMAEWQERLESRIGDAHRLARAEWGPMLERLGVAEDSFTPLLVDRLAAINRSGVPVVPLVTSAVAEGALPDEHASGALWWRVSRHLNPTVATEAEAMDIALTADWAVDLPSVFGEERAEAIRSSRWWPTLVEQVDHAHKRGWIPLQLLEVANSAWIEDADPAQALTWRIATLLDPPPDEPTAPDGTDVVVDLADEQDRFVEAARAREFADPWRPSDAMLARANERGYEWNSAPVPGKRIVEINDLAAKYFEQLLPGSWAQSHLMERFGQNLFGDARFRPGYAPAGWTHLVDQLRRAGVNDDELVAAGLAKVSSRATLIDRFRDRLVLPIIYREQVLGFVGRRNPGDDSEQAGPKYLNTMDTAAFSKGAQLYGMAYAEVGRSSIPVVVEGPMDAIAVTLATAGAYIGLAPLGTSLTEEQATQLAEFPANPIIATDADLAGQVAAQRDYWILTQHGIDPDHARLPEGKDPANLLASGDVNTLRMALHQAAALADSIIEGCSLSVDGLTARLVGAASVVAARPPSRWDESVDLIRAVTSLPAGTVRAAVTEAADEWTRDRAKFSQRQLDGIGRTRTRMEADASTPPVERWAPLANALDARLVHQPDWPATADALQALHDTGTDVWATVSADAAAHPLGDRPAYDLRVLVSDHLPSPTPPNESQPRQSSSAEAERKATGVDRSRSMAPDR